MKRHPLSPLLFMAIAITNSISFSLTANSQTPCPKLKPEVTNFKFYDPLKKNTLRKKADINLGGSQRPYINDGDQLNVAREDNQTNLSEKDSSGKCWYKVTITETIQSRDSNSAKNLNLDEIWLAPEAAMYAPDNKAREGDKKKSELFIDTNHIKASDTGKLPSPEDSPSPQGVSGSGHKGNGHVSTSPKLKFPKIFSGINFNTVFSLINLMILASVIWWLYKKNKNLENIFNTADEKQKENHSKISKLNDKTNKLEERTDLIYPMIEQNFKEQEDNIDKLKSQIYKVSTQQQKNIDTSQSSKAQASSQYGTNPNLDVERVGSSFKTSTSYPYNQSESQSHPEQDIHSEILNQFNQKNKQYFENHIRQQNFKKVQPSKGSIMGEVGIGGSKYIFTKSSSGTYLRFLDNNHQYWIIPDCTEKNWTKTLNPHTFENVNGTKLTRAIKANKTSDGSYEIIEKGRFD